ncbi:hypothetical protein AKJ48_00630 [candidate division MSBL1 archaeon SCGC-AAA261O19]|uniref:Trehalose 6-phosphate phosphatase n=2 Tax=candidate division MSBL1 TaxID=215777 RepID=A0A133V2G9_9EURY|nr:hypothetical protein AKJ42_00195 [candidate division MSBL1 archaeon SCGC-AAA261C02]KXB04985.1 hypothetical protein AKJ48_00630 [candidate division MSBL1 archaeon SCGC-AAA261O19]
MELLLENLSELKDKLTQPPFIITDYDGTLTPIAKRPKDARLSQDMREILSQLAECYPVAIVSGRALENIRRTVRVNNVYYVGNHGFEISGPEMKFVKEEAEQARPIMSKLCEDIKKKVGLIKGVIIEDKGLTASIHYRLVQEEEVPKVKKIVQDSIKPYQEEGTVKALHGRKVFEIGPNIDWDKGKAILWLLESTGLENKNLPIYLGDDVTDEDAFRALKGRGWGILVSEEDRKTEAEYQLKNVGEVKTFLKHLIELSRAKTG